jgi:hypothetical protein
MLVALLSLLCVFFSFYSAKGQEVQNNNSSIFVPMQITKIKTQDTLVQITYSDSTKKNLTQRKENKQKDTTKQKENSRRELFKKKDTLEFRNKILKKTSTSGNIGLGYDYGVIPFAGNINIPDGFYKVEGNAGFEVLKFPVNALFYYSTIHNISGMNNYFRLSYDVNKYKEKLKSGVADSLKNLSKSLENLYKIKQIATQKKMYLESMVENKQYQLQSGILKGYKERINRTENDSIEISGLGGKMQFPDSIQNKGDENKSNVSDIITQKEKMLNDSIAFYEAMTAKSDSMKKKADEYGNDIKKYEEKIAKIKSTIEELKKVQSLNPSFVSNSDYFPKYKKILLAVKKFEIGLCNPNYSTFLVNGSTLRGVNIEMEKPEGYFAFTYGKTINTLLINNNVLQNNLLKMQNMLNFFDFNDVSQGRRITVFKFGYGKKESTHLHAGILYGAGLTSYMDSISDLNIAQSRERNYVIELDGRVVINSNNTVDIVYAKSSVQEANQSLSSSEKGFNGIFQPVRSNAAMVAYKTTIKPTKTKLTFASRWIDPFFKSYGVGFLRSDNLRYEVKAEQPVSKKIKVTGLYRKGEDNLLSLYNYKYTIRTLGTNINIKLTRSLSMNFGYNPILQKNKASESNIISYHNTIATGVITYAPKAKKYYSVFNLLYSYYCISDSARNNTFRNINFSGNSQISNSFKNTISAGWLYSNTTDSLNTNTIIMSDNISYTLFKKVESSLIAKYAINIHGKGQVGYGAKINIPLPGRLSAEGSFEKIIVGDFYSSYNQEQIKKFPYYCYFKIIYSW